MKYFNNITTPEELKKAFRAYCVTMHPDKGGDPDEFKKMMNEYEQAAKNCGAWTKDTREEVQGVRRGVRVVFFGAGMHTTSYIITDVQGDTVKLVRIFSHDFRSLDDVDGYLGEDWSDDESRRTLDKYDHIRPMSKKFGIGYYWDDVDGNTCTDKEISEAERIADNFDRWAANWKANKEEEARRAQEEADRRESAIIAEWSAILEKIPEEYKRPDGLDWYTMTSEQRKAENVAKRKNNAARMAAFKRNIKAMFNHYFPGVKVTITNTSKAWREESVISWVDGPSVAEVEAVETFDYFRASYYEPADMYEDYGEVRRRSELSKFRELFGAWSDDTIKYTRTLSEAAAEEVRRVIAENFPQFEADRQQVEAEQEGRGVYRYNEMNIENEAVLRELLGFRLPSIDWQTATDEEQRAYYKAEEPYNDLVKFYRKNCAGLTLDYAALFRLFVECYKSATTEPTDNEQPEAEKQQSNPTDEQEAARAAKIAALLSGIVADLEEIAQAVKTAQTQAKQAEDKTRKQAEAEQLRADIAAMSAQLASMSERIRTMSERLATLEAETKQTQADEPQTADKTEAEPQADQRPERGKDAPDTLAMLRAAAEDVERLTDDNEHVAAALAVLYVLAAVGLRVRPLIARMKAIQEATELRGYVLTEEAADRQHITAEAERRAALFLTPDEFRALYGRDPQPDKRKAS